LSIEDIEKEMQVTRNDVDVVIGGFPCQGFSMAGKRWVDDPRNQLFKEFVRIVEGFQPKVFVAENVVGLVSMAGGQFVEEIKESFQQIGYKVEVKILNSDDYGVPQRRRRAIFIGNKVDVPISFPLPTHSKEPSDNLKKLVTVGEAIDDLPLLLDGFGENLSTYIPQNNLAYQQYMRGDITYEEYQKNAIVPLEIRERTLHNHWTSKSKGMTLDRFKNIGQGENWSALPEHLKTKGKYSNLYRRLHLDFPAVTLTNIRKSMFIHPYEDRLLTVREGARIQSFPDYMVFEGNLGSQQQQIGNAVPPLLGYVIAKKLLEDYSHLFNSMV
jgi:DNA (cytosine-5)-methyltransferase 1